MSRGPLGEKRLCFSQSRAKVFSHSQDPKRTFGSSTATIFEIGCNCLLAIDR